MTENNKWVFYHADCMDGYAAAWAAWKILGDSACYKAVRHHQPMPKFPDDIELYILDFCYPFDTLVSIAQRVRKVVILDHHTSKTSANNWLTALRSLFINSSEATILLFFAPVEFTNL